MSNRIASLILAGFLLGGCSLNPAYEKPSLPVASVYPGATTTEKQNAADLQWRTFFDDPALRQIIQAALQNNRDLRVATLNVSAYKAKYRIRKADLLPVVTADANGSRQSVPADLSPNDQASVDGQYSVGLNMSYELDFFGRIQSLNEEALQEYLATEQAQSSVRLSLVASVANAWLTWKADQQLLHITADTVNTYQRSYQLTQSSAQIGTATALAVRQTETLLREAQGKYQQYLRQVAQDYNLLVALVGESLPSDLPVGEWARSFMAEIPVGLPSELLIHRPDILEAEHRLKAANADIGAARAAFFPRISLTAGGGTSSNELSNLFRAGSGGWSFAPAISLPIFNAGSLQASLDVARIGKDINVARYEGVIQVAFKEVSDGLAATQTYREQVESQQQLVDASAEYYRLAESRYQTGIDSSLTLLDAQRTLFSAQQALVVDQLAARIAAVDLYKALGGGWDKPTI